MPLYEINTVSTYRHKYMIESKQLNDAYDILRAGNVDEIIYLMPSNCGTRWSTTLLEFGFDVCFLEKQQKFIHSTKENLIKSPWGSILYYHGSNSAKFNQIFSEIGHVYKKG